MRLHIGLIALVFLTASSTAMAMQPRRYTDDEKEFFKSFYESCKKSVEENLSEKDFQKTMCFAHIKGSEEAASAISMSFGFAVMGYAKTCKEIGETIELFSKEICVPENLTSYQIARDYVKFVESEDYKPHHQYAILTDGLDPSVIDKIIAEASKKYYQSPADLYHQIYACKTTNNPKAPDVR